MSLSPPDPLKSPLQLSLFAPPPRAQFLDLFFSLTLDLAVCDLLLAFKVLKDPRPYRTFRASLNLQTIAFSQDSFPTT